MQMRSAPKNPSVNAVYSKYYLFDNIFPGGFKKKYVFLIIKRFRTVDGTGGLGKSDRVRLGKIINMYNP